MIITKLLQKYKTGCGKGISYVEEPMIQLALNSIIDWDLSIFENPEKDNDQFIEPGDCFCIGIDKDKARMVLALDSQDKLVCILNDTGYFALERIVKEKIMPEFQLINKNCTNVDVRTWEPKVTALDLPDKEKEIIEVPIDKNKYRMVKSRLTEGRGIVMPEAFIKVVAVSDETMGMEINLYFTKYAVYTDKDSMFADMTDFMSDFVDTVFSWIYHEVLPVKPKLPELPEDEEKEEQP